jgi:hypothetical protein
MEVWSTVLIFDCIITVIKYTLLTKCRLFWHAYVLHEGITYKSRVPRTSQITSLLLRHMAAAMRAHNVLCNSYNSRDKPLQLLLH